ncbi:hypothetical protein SS50377_23022 [Spironucleus salmonicida]|uniref:MSP domain-containing protein n=1 Tax=Spironucleus salmonicida TaxID=348837 RepID=V6LSL1_9EUKA|nr:hypothetical protein SS50377_23022 [Spironucleus salmonicida]|eukprot:EST47600.1 hypothetical protein SS50377_12295 [Spironucleus salmonicida]
MNRNTTVLSKDKRKKYFSIDCQSEIIFSAWKPDGRVYTKQLIMKNIGNQLITLTYKLPEMACFFTPYPDQIVLPVGMEHAITVSFQPVNPVEVESELVFFCNQHKENFIIHLRGDLPLLSAKTTLQIQFPSPTAVAEQQQYVQPLVNDGEVPFLFKFQNSTDLFEINPSQGALDVGQKIQITYTFKPTEAGQICSHFFLEIRKADLDLLAKVEKVDYEISAVAFSKFPFIRTLIDDSFNSEVDFTNTPILSEISKQVILVNDSPVSCSFKIDDDIVSDKPYSQIKLSVSQGVIGPNGKFPIQLKYKPAYTAGFYKCIGDRSLDSTEYDEDYIFTNFDPQQLQLHVQFKITTKSNASTVFTVRASASPIDLQLSHTKVELGTICCGQSVAKSLYLKNNSKFNTPYEFTCPGLTCFPGVAPDAEVDSDIIKATDLLDVTRSRKRILQDFPLQIHPNSGVATSQINTTIDLTFNLSKFTCKSDDLTQNTSNLTFIPPQPLSIFIQFKTPGAPIQFLHLTATILPEKGLDCRPAPITMKYAEKWYQIQKEYDIDQLIGMMLPFKNDPAIPMNSPLYSQYLPEFETEYASKVNLHEQSLVREIEKYDLRDLEIKPNSNALLPSDSLLQEFQYRIGGAVKYPAKISEKSLNFGYIPFGSDKQKIFTIYNTSERMSMFVGLTGLSNLKNATIEFIGLSPDPYFQTKDSLEPFYFQVEDGLEYRTALTKGLVAKIPPQYYGFFQVTFRPSQPDESFYTKFALFCVHHPLLLYRCFRHSIVGASFIQEIRVAGFSRIPDSPSLLSSIPLVSKPVIQDKLRMPPVGPGSVSRISFAFTNQASTFIVISLSKLLYNFVQVTPDIIGLNPKQTTVVSVCITFPKDSITNKEKYGFTFVQGSQNQVQFDDVLVFNINGSQITRQDISFQAICSGVDVVLDKVNTQEQIVASQQDKVKIQPVVMRMAPVSLGSESNRFFTFINKSILPSHITFEASNQRDSQLMYTQPNDIIIPGCEFTNYTYTLRAMEKYLQEQSYKFDLDVRVEIPYQFSTPSPKNLLLNTKLNFSLAQNVYEQKVSIETSIARRTVDLTPKTVNLGPIVPYTSIDIPIQIYNSSHCSISYTLEIHEIFTEMNDLPFEKTHKTARKYSYISANENGDYLVPSLYNKLYNTESVMSPAQTERCPQIFIRSGAGSIILPQSSNNAMITIMPFSTNTVRARIYAKIIEIESYGRKFGEVINELENKSVYIQGTANALNSIISKEKEIFECRIEVSADYPKFFISDISCPTIGSNQMRDIMEVDSINTFLASDVTMAERVYVTPCSDKEKLMDRLVQEKNVQESEIEMNEEEHDDISENQSEKSGDLHINPVPEADNMKEFTVKQNNKPNKDLSQKLLNQEEKLLQEFPIVLGPDNRCDGKEHRINLTLANPGVLPVEISIEMPTEHPSLDAAPWASALPSQKQQITMSLLARKIFTVSPEEVKLQPGQKHSISITYSHQEEGVHELVVLVKIKGGRTFFFHLVGQTLAEDEPALIAPVEFKLLPVAVGEVTPPRQFLKMNNPGNVPVSYKLVNPEFIFADQENDGIIPQQATKILRCLNPSGYIAPQSSTVVILQFQPNQIGLVQIKYDLVINTSAKINVLDTQVQQQKFFENECTVDLPENLSINPKQQQFLPINSSLDEDSKVYQTLSIIGYGFIPQSTIPQLVVPSHSLIGNHLKPDCGAVSILQNSASSLTSQRGLGICQLSCGRLVLGGIPVFGFTSTIIEISAGDIADIHHFGYSKGHFEWEIRNHQQFINKDLSIKFSPNSGTLKFNETTQINVQISSGPIPSVFLEDVPFTVRFVPEIVGNTNYEAKQENFSRLPVVLANTVASAARISETAILQQFDPSEINKAGLDQAGRHAHAMLYGVDDRVSKVKSGPLSQYADMPLTDVLWLTITLHSHRLNALHYYRDCEFGLQTSQAAIALKGVENQSQNQNQELSEQDSKNLAGLVGNALRSAVGKLATEEESQKALLQAAKSAKRDAVNGLNPANFFESEFDNPVEVMDSEVAKRTWEIDISEFLQELQEVVYQEIK